MKIFASFGLKIVKLLSLLEVLNLFICILFEDIRGYDLMSWLICVDCSVLTPTDKTTKVHANKSKVNFKCQKCQVQ
jgi:hypothetical protein